MPAVERVDAVLWTHDHADQLHGIDDLRPFMLRHGQIELWSDARTYEVLQRRFGYCFMQEGYYAAIYRHNLIDGPFRAAGIAVTPIPQDHGSIPSLGFRFGRFAYANDVVELPDEAFEVMEGVEVLVIDAMRYRPHPTHAHLDRTLGNGSSGSLRQRAFLTNLHVDMDYAELDRQTPAMSILAMTGW